MMAAAAARTTELAALRQQVADLQAELAQLRAQPAKDRASFDLGKTYGWQDGVCDALFRHARRHGEALAYWRRVVDAPVVGVADRVRESVP